MKIFYLLIFSILIASCGVVKDSPKYNFANGYYKAKTNNQKSSRVFVQISEDNINVYPVSIENQIDTAQESKTTYPKTNAKQKITSCNLKQKSFDVDFLTIPVKYRPSSKSLPRQINANLNGAVYFGFRNDVYRIWYDESPLKSIERKITHYGYSVGVHTGLGSTAMNPWVTKDSIAVEYDGVVWGKGVAGILAVNNFTIGVALGWDHLLDKNRKYWIYQGKPWVGLAFGLNLN